MSLNPIPSTMPGIWDTFDEFTSTFQNLMPSTVRNQIIGTFSSCGVSVLSGLRDATPKQIVDKILKERHPNDSKKIREAFVTFSDTNHDHIYGGNALYRYIKDNKLGDIVEMGPRMNPNTGNMIKFWVWAPPHEDLNPVNKFMPVYGKIMQRDQHGNIVYVADPRFQENRNTREA